MKRRNFMTVLAGAAAYPLFAGAQQKATPVIGFLGSGSPGQVALFTSRLAAFRHGLAETDWGEGQNVSIEYRWAEGHLDRLPALAADFVGRKVDVIGALSAPSALAAKNATSTIPIVFTVGIDPVAAASSLVSPARAETSQVSAASTSS